MKFVLGKVPINVLKDIVFKNLGVNREEVVLGPSAGIDGAVIDIGNKSLIVSMDPITGAIERIGWLAININANDVATFGVEPAFFFSCILLPENADKNLVEKICVQMDKAARELEIAIAGGHCEVSPGLIIPIVIGCVIGVTEKENYITAAGAKPGDKLILTKSAGIEGTAILASDKEKQLKKAISTETLQNAKKFYNQISIVKDAKTAFKTGGVHAMHDPTEGGVVGGIYEMVEASNLGVKVFKEKISVQPETAKICEFFNIDPLYLVSSGALLISAKPELSNKIIKNLEQHRINATIIGEFSENSINRVTMDDDGRAHVLPRQLSDHLWTALSR